MVKFVFVTQQSRTATRQGPSGSTYVINKGLPFKVSDSLDVEYFDNNKRFRRVGILESPKQELQKEPSDILKAKLSQAKRLSAKTVDKLVEIYQSEENLVDAVEQGNDLDSSITKKQQEVVRKLFVKEEPKSKSKKQKGDKK